MRFIKSRYESIQQIRAWTSYVSIIFFLFPWTNLSRHNPGLASKSPSPQPAALTSSLVSGNPGRSLLCTLFQSFTEDKMYGCSDQSTEQSYVTSSNICFWSGLHLSAVTNDRLSLDHNSSQQGQSTWKMRCSLEMNKYMQYRTGY